MELIQFCCNKLKDILLYYGWLSINNDVLASISADDFASVSEWSVASAACFPTIKLKMDLEGETLLFSEGRSLCFLFLLTGSSSNRLSKIYTPTKKKKKNGFHEWGKRGETSLMMGEWKNFNKIFTNYSFG